MKLNELLCNITRYTSDAMIVTHALTADEIERKQWPNIVFVNDAFSALTGYRAEEVIGKSIGIFCTDLPEVSILDDLHEVATSGRRLEAEVQICTKMKLIRWIEFTCSIVHDANSQACFMVITARDITDRKTMQDATEQQSLAFLYSETRQRAIMNSIADGIITVAEDGSISAMSTVAERLFGVDSTEAEGTLLTHLFAEDCKTEIEAIIAAKMLAQNDLGRLATHDVLGRRRSGETFHARITCSTLLMGAQKNMVIAARDVSQEKEVMQALRIARDAAERASKAKSEFLANMSHELRTPMNGILGLAEVLKEAPLHGEHREYLEALNVSAESLLTILNDILDFSKIEAGEMALENTPFSLHSVGDYVQDLLQQVAQKKSLQLVTTIPEGIHEWVLGDVHRLKQVLVNLMGNALKFTASGSVTLSMELHKTSVTQQQEITFHVHDTGMGIDEAYLPFLFNKFSQADSSNTRKFGGTGLGLAISQQLVGLMGGTIQVESTVGKGSHFWFTLRFEKAEAPMQSEQHVELSLPADKVKQSRVLIAEDHPINMLLLKKLLTKLGFSNIDHAENGVEALSMWKMHTYDLIFMDCQMPIMDGYDATQAIREMEMRENRSHTPVIAMTANAMKGDKETCLRMGMDAYVSKPIDISRTQHAIRTCWHITNDADTDVSLQPEALHNEMDAPVNMEHLSMFTDGDAEEECALFSIFLQNAQHTLNLLRESAQKQDPEAWRKAAHLLKGASGNLGAQHLFACCSKAEEKAKAGKITVFDEDLQAIECALEDVTQFIHTRAA